jgi:hypothetical protein
MTKKDLVTIKLPKANSVFYRIDENEIYIYKGFNKKINGHMLVTCDDPYITYVCVCHTEFEENYFLIGDL